MIDNPIPNAINHIPTATSVLDSRLSAKYPAKGDESTCGMGCA